MTIEETYEQTFGVIRHLLARRLTGPAFDVAVDRDDLLQIALLAIWRRRHAFDASKGTWLRFALDTGWWAIRSEARLATSRRRSVPTVALEETDWWAVHHDPEPATDALEIASRVLHGDEAAVIMLTFGVDETQREVARVIGLTQSRVSQLRSSALRRLRDCPEIQALAA